VPLLHIANKLLGRQNLNFDQLTPPEQKLWNFFENSDIYKFLIGEKAPGASFVMVALVDFLTDFHIDLHFSFSSCEAC